MIRDLKKRSGLDRYTLSPVNENYTHTIESLTIAAGTIVSRPGSRGASFTEADDKGDGEEDMESAGWGRVMMTTMSLSVMVWLFWLEASGQWCVINSVRARYLPTIGT